MATYTVQYNGLVGQVKAYNQLSAEAQMEWVEKNVTCFCNACRIKLVDMYSVTIPQIPLSVLPCPKDRNPWDH